MELIKKVEELKKQGYKILAFVSNDGLNYSENAFKTDEEALEYLIERADLEKYKEDILSGKLSIHDFGDFFNMVDIDEHLKEIKEEL